MPRKDGGNKKENPAALNEEPDEVQAAQISSGAASASQLNEQNQAFAEGQEKILPLSSRSMPQVPEQPKTSFTQTSQESDGSEKQVPDVENITKALSELSLQEKQKSPSQLASSSMRDRKKNSMEVMKIPQRKDFTKAGTLGHNIHVLTNMFQIDFGSNFKSQWIHYDVDIVPNRPKYLMWPVFKKAQKELFPEKFPAFDGKKNAYSAGLLPFGNDATIEVAVFDENGIEKQFKITFKKVAEFDLAWLKDMGPGLQYSGKNHSCVQALDIVLRTAPVLNGAIPIGRLFFTTPPQDQIKSLGGGLDLWIGHFQTATLGWKPFLTVDVAHKGFPTPQSVIDLMKTICGCGGQGSGDRGPSRGPPVRQSYERNPYDQSSTELTAVLIEKHRDDITKVLKGLKIVYEIPGLAKSRRTRIVHELTLCPRLHSFNHSDGRRLSIENYYQVERNYTIKHPDFPCLWVGPKDKNIHVPVELCKIVGGQAIAKRLNENQTLQMVHHVATNTADRKKKIMDAFNKMGYNEDLCTKEFGISVNGEFTAVPARVLDPPLLAYKNKEVTVSNGQWRAGMFLESSSSISEDYTWTILNLNFRTQDSELYGFAYELQKIAGNLGVKIGKPVTPFTKLDTRHNCINDLIYKFTLWKSHKIKLVIVIVPEIKGPYCWIKQVSELNVGIITQCLKNKTLLKIKNDRSPATLTNILLKINAKLNGVNHAISTRQLDSIPFCLTQPCMIVGTDVSHPPPDGHNIPSIAAVVASHDPQAFRYNTEIRLQPPNVEAILDLTEIMKIQLEFFYKKTGYWPLRIIFYRDGVGEGYFAKILQNEVPAIRRACKEVEPKVGQRYEPPITFFVVQKRHHTRFFPVDPKETADKNCNVRAGTTVDTVITHPTDIEFYIVSHSSIQGTARPTKYKCLWDDANMSQDEMEQLTYFLCHMFSRCTRAISYPTPTYNAHLAAFRARIHMQDMNIDKADLLQERFRKFNVNSDLLKGSPMYFV